MSFLKTPDTARPAPLNLNDLRDQLINRASYGEITNVEAESEAAAHGLGPFERTPDIDRFDPMKLPNWTIPMAVAWIVYRDPQAVRDAWPAYCAECWYWLWQRWRNGPGGEMHEGWILKNRDYPTLDHVQLMYLMGDDDGRVRHLPIRDARESLWSALGEGMIAATAIPRSGGDRVAIPAVDWSTLRTKSSDHRDELARDGSLAFVDALLPSKGVRFLWSEPLSSGELPSLVIPEGDGYMPLYCAAQWVATEGGARNFDPSDTAVWREAFNQLLSAIASERIRTVGLHQGKRERVPPETFAGIDVDYPFDEPPLSRTLGPSLYLRSYPYLDDQHWRNGFDDSIVSRHGDHWIQLVVEKGDVRQRWPFGTSAPQQSGAVGRPSSMHLIMAEFERRIARGATAAPFRAESEALATWLSTHHPDSPRAGAKAIANNIRARYREVSNRTK